VLRYQKFSPVLSFAVLLGGCPNRQTGGHIVYVPSPAPSTTAAQSPPTNPAVLTIEEPAPEEVSTPAPQQPTETEVPRTRREPHRAATSDSQQPEAQPAAPPVNVPPIAPHEPAAQESEMRTQVITLQQDVNQRLVHLGQVQLSDGDRKTLETARAFLSQSNQALQEGDLQRAFNLAHKASLLVKALSP
jgi:hypothetical protein